jgi:glutamate--cysteine ligase
LDSVGLDETHYLKPLFKIAETGQTQAEELLCAYERQWKKSVIPVYSQYSY